MRLPRRFLLLPLLAGILTLTNTTNASADTTPNTPKPRQAVVILIPGYGNPTLETAETPLGQALRDAGYLVIPANVTNMTGDLTVAAHTVRNQALTLRTAGHPNISLVGISAGGVVARAAITIDYAERQHTFTNAVTLGAAHNGTDLEALGPGWECHNNPACLQLKPTSPFMQNLPPLPAGKNATPLTSIWTQDDLVAAPETTRLTGATNIHLQHACPGIRNIWTGHESLTSSPAFTALTITVLTGTPPAHNPYGCTLNM